MSDDLRLPPPCAHLAAYRSNAHGLSKPFRSLQRCLRPRPLAGRTEIRRDPQEIPRCASCAAVGVGSTGPRLYACLACAAVSCSAHAADHAGGAPGHEIAVDVDRAELFCCACGDQIYDCDFDAAVVLARTKVLPLAENLRKRRKIEYRQLVPDPRGSSLLELGPVQPRGMNNLGSTCFMNSVLQALMHAEPLRNYFLRDQHNRFVCQERRKKTSRLCLACDLDAVYSAVFSGDPTPYSPAKFLYSWWQHASNLASYEQQDAHEFFISMLDGIHEKLDEDEQKPPIQGSEDCCIAHRVFSGILRSDVTCINCGFTSTTYDPCIDISLDLDSSQRAKKLSQCNGEKEELISNQNSPSLMGCLERFTRPERLGSDEKFFCQRCQVRQEFLKQMSIRKLPLVICFHIKRFEHSSIRKASRKVDSYLQFPFSLDMSPYLSSSILRSRFGNRIFVSETDDSNSSTELAAKFELFAVITHCGRLESGHYTTYIHVDGQWYKCDDAWVTRVNENIVRASQAYMLFYVQKMSYQDNENTVTPVRTHEHKAPLEQML